MNPLPRPVAWLLAANWIWFVGAILAYASPINFLWPATLAGTLAGIGMWDARRASRAPQTRLWLDRAFSAATGGAVVAFVLVSMPYVLSLDGVSLWTSKAFAGLGMLVVGAAWGAWNAFTVQAMADDGDLSRVRPAAIFHALVVLAATLMVWLGRDAGVVSVMHDGFAYASRDLTIAPALLGTTAILWGLLLFRCRRFQ